MPTRRFSVQRAVSQVLGLFPLLPDKMKVDRDARTKKPVYTHTKSDEQNPNFNGASRIEYNKFANDHESIKEDNVVADFSVAERQIAHTNQVKAERDNAAVDAALGALKEACRGTENTMPYLIKAVKTYATLGEICGAMKEVFGEYHGGNAF